MASRDVLVLNTTASRAETQQGSDTVAIRGNSSQALSVENSSGTSVLSVDSYSSSIQLTGDITASGNISSSLSSTASIGRLEATTLIGSAFNLTGTAIENTISSSAQIAPYISGSFRRGFEFTGIIGDQPGGLDNKITASFGRIVATSLSGSAANLTNTVLDNTISSSAQIASQISGAFTRGFNFDGKISGSVTSTGSFTRIDAITLAGDGTELTNIAVTNTISSSAQIASQISGSFIKGFEFEGTITSSAGTTNKISVGKIEATTIVGDISNMTGVAKAGFISSSGQIASQISGAFNRGFTFDGSISGSSTSTGSFGRLVADSMAGDISAMSNIFPRNTVSSSAQIASRISGAFEDGFEFTGKISASAGNTNTGSFSHLVATTITGDVSGMTGTAKAGFVSGSAQLATSISGSFNQGFRFSGSIQKFEGVWSAGGNLISAKREAAGIGTKAGALVVGGTGTVAESYIADTEEYNGTSFSEVNNLITARCGVMGAGTTEAGIIMGGEKTAPGTTGCTEVYNGTNWSEEADMNYCTKNSGDAGDSSEAAIVFGGNFNTPASHYTGQSEEYNGTTWSEINSLNVSRTDLAGLGNSESALAVAGCPPPGGHAPGNGYDVEEWNGTNWSEVADTLVNPHLNTEIKGSGTVNDGHAFGGFYRVWPSSYFWNGTRSQHFDGTAWAYGGGLIQGRSFGAGDGTSGNNSFYAGGYNPGIASPYLLPNMEEYSRAFTSGSFGRLEAVCVRGDISNMTGINSPTILTGSSQIASQISGSFNKGFNFTGTIQNEPYTFTEVAALIVARQSLGASGIKTAGLVFGGYAHPTQVASTETFNGSSWSEVNDLIAAGRGIGGSGTSTATVAFGGHPTRNQYTEEWNGTNWSEVNDLIRSDFACQAADIGHSSEAAIAAGSCTTATFGAPSVLCNEEWNGTNWATANALIHNASQTGGGAGSANAGITAGGFISPGYPGAHRCTQLWNGTNWSEAAAALPPSNHRGILYGWGGSQNDAIITSGCSYQGGLFDTSYCYNGISWSAGSAIGTLTGASSAGVYRHKGAGTTVDNSFFAGGIGGGGGNNSSIAAAFCTDNGVATGSFSHIDAIRITGSVDGMTNIPEPAGTISSSAQIASSVSGSFNKGFEFSGEIRSLGGWSAGGDFPGNIKHNYFGGVWGTQNSALLGGGIGIYQGGVCDTYSYNGTSWSDTGANMNDSKGGYTAHGTENAALAAGGIQYKSHIFQYLRINTEEWNGSAWSFTTNLPHQLAFLNNQKGGTQNASLIAGGYTGAGSVNQGSGSEAFQKSNLDWDGLSYTIGASMDNERASGAFVGSMNAGLAQGGGAGHSNHSTCTEEWNGSAWSTAAASNFPTQQLQTVGTSNNAMHTTDSGNSPYLTACTDFYNGISWDLGPTAPSGDTLALKCAGSAGSTSAGLFMAYGSSCVQHFDDNHTTSSIGRVDATELSIESNTDLTVNNSFQLPIFAANPEVTSSAGEVWYNRAEEKLYFTYDINSWTEVADTITSHNFGGYAGGVGQGIVWGSGGNTINSEVWDGNAWSEVNDLNTGRSYVPGAGSSNAAIAAGGCISSTNITEIWDGTSWTEVNDGAIGYSATYTGTVNAGLQAGCRGAGDHQPDVDTKEWNGTNWSAGGDLITAKADYAAMAGTQNAAKHMGGGGGAFAAPLYITNLVEDYNGTSFSTAVSLPYCVMRTSGGGTQNAAILAGGYSNTDTTSDQTYEWNGVSFSQTANLGTGRCTGDIADGSQSSFQVSSGGSFGSTTCKNTEQYTTTGIGCACIGGV